MLYITYVYKKFCYTTLCKYLVVYASCVKEHGYRQGTSLHTVFFIGVWMICILAPFLFVCLSASKSV